MRHSIPQPCGLHQQAAPRAVAGGNHSGTWRGHTSRNHCKTCISAQSSRNCSSRWPLANPRRPALLRHPGIRQHYTLHPSPARHTTKTRFASPTPMVIVREHEQKTSTYGIRQTLIIDLSNRNGITPVWRMPLSSAQGRSFPPVTTIF